MKPITDKTRFISAVIILAASLICYSGSFDNSFLPSWDDSLYVSANPDIQSVTAANLKKIWSRFYVGNYAPVQMMSYMADYQVWGGNPFGFILTNAVLHGINGILFYLLVSLIHPAQRWALPAALLFVMHPVQVESVAWISQRKNVLSMTFFLSSLLCYISYRARDTVKCLYYPGCIVFFALALLTKSVTVILPVILIGYDLLLQKRKNCLSDKLPLIAMAAAVSALAMISQTAEQGGGMAEGLHGGSAYATALTMLTVYKKYLLNIAMPVDLSAFYNVTIRKVIDRDVLVSLLTLAASVASLRLFPQKSRRPAAFWLLMFFAAFIPVSQIVPLITLMNDRYLYFPMLGLCSYVIMLADHFSTERAGIRRAATVLLVCILLTSGYLTWQRTQVWKDTVSLWEDAARKQPGSVIPWYGLALHFDKSGDQEKARGYYRHALTIQPDHKDSLYNLGLMYLTGGEFHQSLPLFERLAAVDSRNGNNLQMLAINYHAAGMYAAARTVYEQALAKSRDNVNLLNLAGMNLERLGSRDAGRQYWNRAVAAGGKAGELLLERARVECISRRTDAALAYIAEADHLTPGIAARLVNDDDFTILRMDDRFLKLLLKR